MRNPAISLTFENHQSKTLVSPGFAKGQIVIKKLEGLPGKDLSPFLEFWEILKMQDKTNMVVLSCNNDSSPDQQSPQINGIIQQVLMQDKNIINIERTLNISMFCKKDLLQPKYGDQLITELSKKLLSDFGKGFSPTNIKQMRSFYISYSKSQTLSDQFKLSWSH